MDSQPGEGAPPPPTAPQGRPLGSTERSWLKAGEGGTGITAIGFLLSPPPSQAFLLSALHRLQQLSSPLLRSSISSSSSSSSSSPSLSISHTSNLQLPLQSVPDSSSPPTLHSLLVHQLNIDSPWDAPEGPEPQLFHATLYSLPDPQTAVLVLRIHTALADRTSCFAIARQLIGLLAGSSSSGSGGVELLECLEDLFPAAHKKKAFWARGKDMLGYSLNFTRSSHLPFADARGQRSTDLVMLNLTAAETHQLLAGCQKRGIRLCGVLTAAVLLASISSKHQLNNKSETYCAITLVDCRKHLKKPLHDHDIGFYHSAIQNLHTVKAGEGLWDVAARCYNSFSASLKSNKHFTDMDDLNFLMLRAIQAPQLTPSSSLRTALVSVFDEPAVVSSSEFYQGSCVSDYLGCSSVHGVGPSIALFDTIWDGQLSCACLYPTPLHSKKQMVDLVSNMKSLITADITS